MNAIRKRSGLISQIARELGVAHQTVSEWKQIPTEHVFKVARIARIKPEELRPDFFADDPLRS